VLERWAVAIWLAWAKITRLPWETMGKMVEKNLIGNKYNICTFSLITIPKNAPSVSAYGD
jgi:hypothetical protein